MPVSEFFWTDMIGQTIDVKNINLQIKKKHKNMFFHFYKNIKNMDKKTLNYTIHSS